ncbi:MAG TPA: M24 family metallopeptidase [Thermodesulfobacteriota bacterium]
MTSAPSGIVPGSTSAFPRAEFDARIAAARRLMAARGLDLALVTAPENVFYLTGQQTPACHAFQGFFLPAAGEPFLLVPRLEHASAVANTYLSDVTPYEDTVKPAVAVAALLAERGWLGRKVAIDRQSRFLTIAAHDSLVAALGPLADASGLVESLRVVKSTAEQIAIEEAARYAEAGMRAGLAAVRAGASENAVAAAMLAATIEAGSEHVGMEPLVASGPRSGIPRTTWRRRTMQPGDAVLLELAGCYDRYHAALVRTAWIGRAPERARRMAAACEEALAAALDAMKPGVTCEAVHAACRAVIDRHGYGDHAPARTGSSIGIAFAPDWGEGHILSLSTGVTRELEPGMVFHLSPVLRDHGRFAVGVGETVVVTESGSRPLGRLPRGLVEV